MLSVVGLVWAQKGVGSKPNPGPDVATGGPASPKWDGKYVVKSGGSQGGLQCPGYHDRNSSDDEDKDIIVTVSHGKLRLPLFAYNPATYDLHSHGCDDRSSTDPDCVKMFEAIKASGASLDQRLKLGDIVLTIDKDGNAYGEMTTTPLPLPPNADSEAQRDVKNFSHVAAISGSKFSIDNHGRNSGGGGKGKVASLDLSSLRSSDNAECFFDLRATDYKVSGYCAPSGYACRVDNDCCNHNCVPSTRSCR